MTTNTQNIVTQAVFKTGMTFRYLFLKALQDSGKKMTEEKFDDILLAYRNHGEIPDWVTDYLIDVMIDKKIA